MSSHTRTDSAHQADSRLVDAWLLENLRWNGPQTLDYLSRLFPKLEEAPLLFAIDRLSRNGQVVISPPQNGDYLISVRSIGQEGLREDQHGSCRRAHERAPSAVQ